MPKFSTGQIVVDVRGRIGIILSLFKTKVGSYYNVLIEGEVFTLPEEDLEPKR
jgi:hypothetical protein